MSAKEVKREELKNNFLKKIVVRCDYKGVLDKELDDLLVQIKGYIKEKGFTRFDELYANETDFKSDDPEVLDSDYIPNNEIRRTKLYSFKNDDGSFAISICKNFLIVTISESKYVDFNYYSNICIDILKVLKDNVSFFRPLRFGIRKINQCIILEKSIINEYFDESYYRLFNWKNEVDNTIMQSKDCFSIDSCKVNFVRLIVQGEYGEEKAYQVVLDVDIYSTDLLYIQQIIDKDNKGIDKMNELLFDIYVSTLTKSFIQKLKNDTFSDVRILGVEKND